MKFETEAVQDIRLAQVCCANKSDERYYLQGILMTPSSTNPESLEIVGTDGHRLTKSEIKMTYYTDVPEEPFILTIEGSIPTATARMEFDVSLNKDSGEYCGKVMLFKSVKKASFKSLALKLLKGTYYPRWQRVVQDDFRDKRSHIAFNPQMLAEMAKAAGCKGDLTKLSFAAGEYSAMKVELFKYSTADRPDRVIRLMPRRY